MRRAQSVRHYARPSLALAADDLGVLREGAETDEDVLRRQLLDRDRECDRLKLQVETLQSQLAQRPPVEQIQEIQKEYKNLELLLQGTQRENERCMSELERGKARERLLERKLCELAGENWQSALDIPAAGPPATRSTMLGHQRTNTLTSPMTITTLSGFHHRQSPSPTPYTHNNGSSQDQSEPPSSAAPGSQQQLSSQQQEEASVAEKQQALFAHVEQVKMLILGMETRLQTREETLVKAVEKAESESRRFEMLRKEVGVAN